MPVEVQNKSSFMSLNFCYFFGFIIFVNDNDLIIFVISNDLLFDGRVLPLCFFTGNGCGSEWVFKLL